MATDKARNVGRVWNLMKKIGFAMLVTHDGDKVRARPMSAYFERAGNTIFFLTDARRRKDEEITRNPDVNVSFADAGEQKYASVTGALPWFPTTAPKSSNCSRRQRKRGGIAPRIRRYA